MPDGLYERDVVAWPDHLVAAHWRNEVAVFLDLAARAFTPSMRQKITVEDEYRRALRLLGFARQEIAMLTRPVPESCPFALDDLLAGDVIALTGKLADL